MTRTVTVPRINTNDDKVQVVRWYVREGSQVNVGDEIVDLETSKAVVTISADRAGYLRPLAPINSVLMVGDPLYSCAPTLQELLIAMAVPQTGALSPSPSSTGEAVASEPRGRFVTTRFSKAARRLLENQGSSLGDFHGAGLVTARHLTTPAVLSASTVPTIAAASTPTSAPSILPKPMTSRIVDVSLGKQAEIQSLTIGERGNVNSMLSICFHSRKIRRKLISNQEFNGSVLPIILFELAQLLKKWPQYTAYFLDNCIHYYDRVDLGLAVDMGKGLKVVKIENADILMPVDFYAKSLESGLRYMRNKIKLEDMVGTTITVSDLSGMNIMYFHPLINGYQSAIIGIGGDASQPGQPMTINMTFDHRVSSGREAASFLNELRSRILKYAL